MLYFFCGTDVEKTRAKAFAWIAAAKKKEPNLSYARLTGPELTDAALQDVVASGGLFVRRLLVLIDSPFLAKSDDGAEEANSTIAFEEYLNPLARSDNAIVVLAPALSAARIKKITPYAKNVYTFDRSVVRKERGFNSALVNALVARNREKLWLELIRAERSGDVPEMVHGLLHWEARQLMQKGTRGWTKDEARKLSLSLLSLLQDARQSGRTLARNLETWVLSI